jgi:hypothetical protein
MAEEKEKKESLWWKLRHRHYRLVLLDHETLEQVGSYTLTLANFYVLASSMLVGFATLVVALIVLTPLKYYIPGYSGADDRPIRQLSEQVRDLEGSIRSNDKYITDFRRMLTEDVEKQKDLDKSASGKEDSSAVLEPGLNDFDEF